MTRPCSTRLRFARELGVLTALAAALGCADTARTGDATVDDATQADAPTHDAAHVHDAAAGASADAVTATSPPSQIEWGLPEASYWEDLRDYPGVGAGRIVVTNSLDDTLSILDLSQIGSDDFGVIATVPVGLTPIDTEGPQGLVADASGEHYYFGLNKYVLNADSAPGGHGLSVADGYVIKMRADDNAPVGLLRVDRVPSDLRLTPDGRRLLVSHHDLQPIARLLYGEISDPRDQDTTLVIVDVASMTREAKLSVCPGTHGIAVSPDSSTAYVTCVDDRIAVIDLDSPEHAITFVPVLAEPGTALEPVCFPFALTLSPDASQLWVSCFQSGELRCFDTERRAMDEALVTRLPGQAAFGTFDAAGKRLFVPYQQSHGIARVDPASGELLQDIDLPADRCANPRRVLLTDDERRLIVLCEGPRSTPGAVAIVDAETGALERTAPVGRYPLGIDVVRGAP